MNFVIVKHQDNTGKFLFAVPAGKHLEFGDKVLCDTRNGQVYGVCCCDSFRVEERDRQEELTKIWGTNLNAMRYVVGKYSVAMFDNIPEHDNNVNDVTINEGAIDLRTVAVTPGDWVLNNAAVAAAFATN